MNTINFQNTGGFPLETNTLGAIQTAYSMFNSLGELAGDKTIIKGCIQTGNTISDGLIYVNGEVIEFRSGQIQLGVVIRDDITEGIFEDGTSKPIYHTRYAKFGTGHSAIPWIEFKRIDPMLMIMQRLAEVEKKAAVFQQGGGMVFWNRPENEIPEGWQEVEDWRGRFPVGMDVDIPQFDSLGKEDGEIEVTLTKPQMPKHTPTGSIGSNGSHNHNTSSAQGMVKITGHNTVPHSPDNSSNEFDVQHPYSLPYDGAHNHILSMDELGNDEAHNNLPPYRTVLFIEYVG